MYLDTAYFAENWKNCSKIIFKCVNSAMRPIFNESLILVNYGHSQMVGFRQERSQSLVKVSQTQSNLINGPKDRKSVV